jgi:hypothetical protein
MRTASILLALVVVLGFVSEAGAEFVLNQHQCTFHYAKSDNPFNGIECFGICDWLGDETEICFGPLGSCKVPFTAMQGMIGFCLIVVTFIALLVFLSVRWKRKQPSRL